MGLPAQDTREAIYSDEVVIPVTIVLGHAGDGFHRILDGSLAEESG